MATIDTGTSILLILLALGMCILLAVGLVNIRLGQQAMTQTRTRGIEGKWHQQPRILFGINNMVFALLLLCVLLLTLFTSPTVRLALILLAVLTFFASLILVVRNVLSSLRTINTPPPSSKAQEKREDNDKDSADQG